MKTSKFIIVLAAILFVFSAKGFAKPIERNGIVISANIAEQTINEVVNYPEIAKSAGIEGFVLIQYHVTPFGNVLIDAINGSNKLLMDYVQNKVNNLQVQSSECKLLYARFVFKLY
ncbi:MAG: hypothetical protein WCQ95_04905 [Bacteroidota bacterium]